MLLAVVMNDIAVVLSNDLYPASMSMLVAGLICVLYFPVASAQTVSPCMIANPCKAVFGSQVSESSISPSMSVIGVIL